MKVSNYFVDRESGQTIRVEKVTPNFANITVVKQLPSTYMMPVAIYDEDFVKRYIPLDIGNIVPPEGFRLPKNAAFWDEESAAAAEPEQGDSKDDETDEGVVIGDASTTAPATVNEAYAAVKARAIH